MDGQTGAAGAPTSDDATNARFDMRTVLLMSGAHFVHDCYPAFVAVLMPLLIPKFGLSLAEVGILSSGIRWSTLAQPIVGYIADRTDMRYFVVVAPTTTAVLISSIGLAPSAVVVFVLLVLAGFSHATFHPAAASLTTHKAGDRWGKGTSYFMTGGELGRAVGPIFIAAVLTAVGLSWSWIALFPGLAFSIILYGQVRGEHGIRFQHQAGSLREAFQSQRRNVLVLSSIIVLRSVANSGLVTFLPTWLVAEGHSLVYAGMAIAIYEIGGTAGAFVGGTVSDTLGRRNVLAASLATGLPAMALALAMPAGPLQLGVLGVAGFALLSSNPVQLVMCHELFPDNRSAATGISYFMATFGSILAMNALGIIGDQVGLHLALGIGIVVGAIALPAIALLPHPRPGSSAAAA